MDITARERVYEAYTEATPIYISVCALCECIYLCVYVFIYSYTCRCDYINNTIK